MGITSKQTSIDHLKLLRGQYELERLPGDFTPDRIVPDFAFNVLNQAGLLYRPVVDLGYLRSHGSKPKWPGNKQFAVCLTHDVDAINELYLPQSLRRWATLLSIAGSASKKLLQCALLCKDALRLARRGSGIDPYNCFERWLEAENSIGAKSTFFFWPGLDAVRKHHFSDCLYTLSDRIVFEGQKCSIAEMIREVSKRGWEVGLHSSWFSYSDVDELKRQKETLERALGKDVFSVRQGSVQNLV